MFTPRLLVPLRRILFACGVFLLGLSSALAQVAVSTLAGSSPAIASGNVNAAGTAARFNALSSVAVDSAGNIYVADTNNHTIRKVTADGVVTTLAGSGVAGAANGTGAAASFRFPQGVATDGTNVYVADTYNHAIRQIVISNGLVTTLAGTVGTSGTANGTGVAATFNSPLGLAVSGTDLYVADTGSHTIRKIVISSGVVTTFAGTAGTNGFADGTGVAATFKNPGAIAAEGTTNLYVADTANHTIRKIVIGTAVVTTLAGTGNGTGGSTDSTGAAASFKLPGGLVVGGANLFVADTGNNTLRQIVLATGAVTTIAGTAGTIGTTDAIGTSARFQGPTGIGVSTGGTLYIADTNNHTLRTGGAAFAPTVSNPASATVYAGTSVTFTIVATGSPSPTIQWERQPANTVGFTAIAVGVGGSYSGMTSSTLTVSNVTLAMSGDQFRAVITNGIGGSVTSGIPAVLTVQQPLLITSVNNAAFGVGLVGSFTVTTIGSPAPTFSITAGSFPPWAILNPTTGEITGSPSNATGSPFTFTIQASNGVNLVATQSFTLAVTAPRGLTNLSGMCNVPAVGLTAYFRVEGAGTKQVLIRVAGPSLGAFGVSGTLADPRLDLINETGAIIASNDDWGGGAQLSAAMTNVGAFAFSAGSKDAAILATLSPGFYTVRINGVGSTTGQAIVEIYEADPSSRTAFFSYLALRGSASYTVGFTVSGASYASVVVRAAGPALQESGGLSDPILTVFRGSGSALPANDNWDGDAGIASIAANFGGIPFMANSKDSALRTTLAPGSYSAQVSGVGGTTGVALVEIFDASASTAPRSPFVLSPPAPQSIAAGQTASFSVTAGGTGALGYQWRRNGTPISGATSPSYSFTAAVADTGSYDVVIANSVGSISSVAAALTVQEPARLINMSARLAVPIAGVTAYFRVEGTATKQILIRGIGPSLAAFGLSGTMADPRLELLNANGAVIAANDDWGTPIGSGSATAAQISAASTSVGAFALSVTSRDAALLVTLPLGFYTVRMVGVGGTTGVSVIEIYDTDQLSRTAGLTYLALRGPVGSGDEILLVGLVLGSVLPVPIMLRAAGPALQEVGALSDPTLRLSGASGSTIATNDNWGGDAGIASIAANFGAIPFTANSRDSALRATLAPGAYNAQVAGSGATHGVALVEIFDASAGTAPRSPFVVSAPEPQSIVAGQTASFSVTAGGTGTLAYQWRRNGTSIASATSANYSFTAAGADAGSYDVTISNSVGAITSVSASLSVTVPAPPVITSATGSGTIGAGFNTVFSVVATSTTPLTYQWRKDNVPISAATNSTLPLNSVMVADSGIYDVVVSNAGGSVTSVSLPLTVTPPVAPTITAQPVGGTLSIGNVASFRVTATGSPTPLYQWRKNSSPIGGATSSVFILGAVIAASAGSYDVVVTNIAGSVTSDAAVLTINPPVVFNSQPLSVSTFVGLGVTFSASAIGFPGAPTYQWRKDTVAITGATSSSFTVAAAQLADVGSYDVIATASAGSATSNAATLSVTNSAPQITAQPAGATLAVGGNATLSVAATGSAPLTYQWRRDGVSILGSTLADLSIANAQTYQAGVYDVVVTNSLGSATGAGARLNVIPRVVAYSARLLIDNDGAVAVFTIEGTLPKKVLLRAIGPGLAPFGFSGLPDPQLELFSSTGTLLAINNDWASSADAAAITTTTSAVGAFALTIGSRDSAVLATLPPGTYTVRAKPASGVGGTGYLELYDADLATGPISTLPYVAVRGRMGAGGGVVIGGLGSNGRGQRSYLVRAIGPTLGLPGAHANPAMLVVRDGTLVGSNDDWDTNATEAAATTTATARVATVPLPTGGRDAALVLTGNLHAGACTVQVGGSDALGGTVLLELHDLDAVRPVTFAPAIASAPVSTTVAIGEATTLRVLAQGTAPLTYQWRKDGIPLDGATTATLSLAAVQASQGGSYTVFVSNALGAATSLSAVLTVQSGGSGSAATQAVVGSGYTAGATATITNTLTYTAAATGLGWKVTLPLGWSFVSAAGMLGDVRPVVGTVGALEWAWSVPPVGPVTFTYTVNVPAGTAGDQFLAASGIVRFNGALSQPIATPSPLLVPQITMHSADTNADFRISLVELTRVIELYNTRLGTTRTGRYLIQDGSEDGYGLDRVTPAGAPVTIARIHSADSNRNADISLFELTRVIELYNVRSGSVRTGAYRLLAGSEDGFAPGPEVIAYTSP